MTAIAWNITPTTTTVATDSRWWDSVENAPGGLSSKMVPLPAHNAVLAGGTWGYMMGQVTARAIGLGFRDLDDLRGGLASIVRDAWSEFLDEAAASDMSPDLCVIWLLGPGCAWLYGNEQDFEPIKLPAGLWCDPDIAPDGGCRLNEPFQGDAHLMDVMRRQRAKREKPSGHPIGGYVTRATITADGIDLKRIGDLEKPGDAQPASNPTAGLTRQQRRAQERQKRKGAV